MLGAGLMGRVAAYFFLNHPEGPFAVRLADAERSTLKNAAAWLNSDRLAVQTVDAKNHAELTEVLRGVKVCVSAIPYFLNPGVARACLQEGVSMVDMGGNPEITDEILAMDGEAKRRQVSLIPDTGLAPGLTNILAWELAGRFKKCDEVHIRVGGLPQNPAGPLKYAQFFSIHGLLNEYFEDARELKDGKEVTQPSPSRIERLYFEEVGELEAFVTSGGTSTLTKTLAGRVGRLDYKTIRYPGHGEKILLLHELGLTDTKPVQLAEGQASPREMLGLVLEKHLPQQEPDMILLRVTAAGDGKREEIIDLIVRYDEERDISAMGQMTSFPTAAQALAILQGKVPAGAHPQETVIPFDFMQEQLLHYGIQLK